MNACQQLAQLKQLARESNTYLRQNAPEVVPNSGCLFVGTSYAENHRLFLGLNPGPEKDNGDSHEFAVDLPALNAWQERGEGYWKNFTKFVGSASGLDDWFKGATCSFCVPWRTANASDLAVRNRKSDGKIAEKSRQILELIWKHHACAGSPPLQVVVAGGTTLNWAATLLNFKWHDFIQGPEFGTGTYQWRKIVLVSKNAVIYQVPHFSRANSPTRLQGCAKWLMDNLNSDATV